MLLLILNLGLVFFEENTGKEIAIIWFRVFNLLGLD